MEMINRLKRISVGADGVFSEFRFDGDDHYSMITAEHAYFNGDTGLWEAKIQPGSYECVRGVHALHSGPVETFEVTGVNGHSGILCCHVGNYPQVDSDGCVLAGYEALIVDGKKMVTCSKATYLSYMARLDGIDHFTLVVE